MRKKERKKERKKREREKERKKREKERKKGEKERKREKKDGCFFLQSGKKGFQQRSAGRPPAHDSRTNERLHKNSVSDLCDGTVDQIASTIPKRGKTTNRLKKKKEERKKRKKKKRKERKKERGKKKERKSKM